jgi:hypothetical protein
VALCAAATLAVAVAPTPARAQSIASRLRARSLHLVHHDTASGARSVLAADAQPDTAFTRIQTVLRALETRATGGDTTAARQLTRFQLEMNAVAQRFAARDAATPPTRALVKEMQRALECAQTGRGCQSPAAVAR